MSNRGEQPEPVFADRLKAIREAKGLTQAQLAEKAGLHLGAVFKLEQGRRKPTWDSVRALAKALGISCEAFEVDTPPSEEKPATKKGKRKK